MIRYAALLGVCLAAVSSGPNRGEGFDKAVRLAEQRLQNDDLDGARDLIRQAQERDPNAIVAWDLRVRWAEATRDTDEHVYALHRRFALAQAQSLPKQRIQELRAELLAADPVAKADADLRAKFIDDLESLAAKYEKENRPHSAIQVHKKLLVLAPDHATSEEAIERLASRPDPSLAADAKPMDLLADVSAEWIADHDRDHATWDTRAVLQRDNYTTSTDAGYEVLVRCAEAMEQMNAFYRQFFGYGGPDDKRTVPRIDLRIFKDRTGYMRLGTGPPASWSGGQFTGDAVETYVGLSGFDGTTQTLFHEAAHQFVSLATNATGWLNEGLASFFEGSRVLGNGSVLMNLPADHRLFPLADRMEQGWMSDANDGLDPGDAMAVTPRRAPTFRIVLEDQYDWGPPWYAPTWGVVYFLYNYQDPWDGRFVYRRALRTFIDTSGGRSGEGAVENFEEVVLAQPAPPTPKVDRPSDAPTVALPKTVAALDAVWKDFILRTRDEQAGRLVVERPFLQWADFAQRRGDLLDAKEHFERGLVAHPKDPDLHEAFAALLAEDLDQDDRATKLYLRTAMLLEAVEPVDTRRVAAIERKLRDLDPQQRTFAQLNERIARATRQRVAAYQEAGLHMMAMDVAWRAGNQLPLPDLFGPFEDSARASGKSLTMWQLAYDEESLEGWDAQPDSAFEADGITLRAQNGERVEGDFSYQQLALDKVTSGDFSFEAEIQANRKDVTFAGLVLGRKSATDFHAVALMPGGGGPAGTIRPTYLDLVTFFGDGSFQTWRHEPIPAPAAGSSSSGRTYRVRADVIGSSIDLWLDDAYVTTQTFHDPGVLRGNFGLIVGKGKASFRNVRYLARVPGDPTAQIERRLRIGGSASAGEDESEFPVSANGSWLGQVPPFPQVSAWAQGERASWDERRGKPQLLVLCSIRQNDMIALDPWMTWLAEEYGPLGLDFVTVASAVDRHDLADYVTRHAFPGAVGVDAGATAEEPGSAFEVFAIDKYNLPRVLLLDIDGRVVWEGDPGFGSGHTFSSTSPSFLRAPLDKLVEQRSLRPLVEWTRRWDDTGRTAFESGDLLSVVDLVREAADLESSQDAEVRYVLARTRAIREAMADPEATLARLESRGVESAFLVLQSWAEALELEVDAKAKAVQRQAMKSKSHKAWAKVEKALKPLTDEKIAGFNERQLEAQLERWTSTAEDLAGPFGDALARTFESVAEVEDFRAAVHEAHTIPGRWLMEEFLVD